MNIYKNITELTGKTPLMHLSNFAKANGARANIIAKLEFFNPAGSVKDRVAIEMLADAEKKGLITENTVVIEPTSGNTGIGLAAMCSAKGYKVILTMPDTMSVERQKLLRSYGAEIVLTDGKLGMAGAIARANELNTKIKGSIIAGQFTNPANPHAHYISTGPEIWSDTDGSVDVFVAGIGTGGTISGTGKFLKEKNPDIKIVGVEPTDSAVLSGKDAGPHKLQGIGAGFVPDTLDTAIYDEIIPIESDDAYRIGRELAQKEGILVGISSGAAAYAALLLSKREENKGKNIVVLLPDSGERYLSTENYFN